MRQLPTNVCLGPLDLDKESIQNVKEFIAMLRAAKTSEELILLFDSFSYLMIMQTTFTIAERSTIVSILVDVLASGVGIYPISLITDLLKTISTLCSAEPPLPITIPWRVTLACVETYAFSTRAVGDLDSLTKGLFKNISQELINISLYYDPDDYSQIYTKVQGYLEDTSTPTNLFKYLALTSYWIPVVPSASLRDKYVSTHLTAELQKVDPKDFLKRIRALLPNTYVDSSVIDLVYTDLIFQSHMEAYHTTVLRDLEYLLRLSLSKDISYLNLYSIYRLLSSCPHLDVSESLQSIVFNFQTTPIRDSVQFEKSSTYFHALNKDYTLYNLSPPDWFTVGPSASQEIAFLTNQASTQKHSLLWCLMQAEACRTRYHYLQGIDSQSEIPPIIELTETYINSSPIFSAIRYIVNASLLGNLSKQSMMEDLATFLTDLNMELVFPDDGRQHDLQTRIVRFVKAPLAQVLYLPVTNTSMEALQQFGTSLVQTLLLQIYIERLPQELTELFLKTFTKAINLFPDESWPMITQMAYQLASIGRTKHSRSNGLPSLLHSIYDQLIVRWFVSRNTTGLTFPEALTLCLPYLSIQQPLQSKTSLLFLESAITILPTLTLEELHRNVMITSNDNYAEMKDVIYAIFDAMMDFLFNISVATIQETGKESSVSRSQPLQKFANTRATEESSISKPVFADSHSRPPSFGLVRGTGKFAHHLALLERVAVSLLATLDINIACAIFKEKIVPFLFDTAIPRRVCSSTSFLAACVAGLESHCVNDSEATAMIWPVVDNLYCGLSDCIQEWHSKFDGCTTQNLAITCFQSIVTVDHLLVSPIGKERLDILSSQILTYLRSDSYRQYCESSREHSLLQKCKSQDNVEALHNEEDRLLLAKRKFTYFVELIRSLAIPCLEGILVYWKPTSDGSICEAIWRTSTEESVAFYQTIVDAVFESLNICIDNSGDTSISYALLGLLTPHVKGSTEIELAEIELNSYKLKTILECLDIKQTKIVPCSTSTHSPAERLTIIDFNDATPDVPSLCEPRFPIFYSFSGCGGGMLQESMRLLSEAGPASEAVRALFVPTPKLASRRPSPLCTQRSIIIDSGAVFTALWRVVEGLLRDGLFAEKEIQDFLTVFASAGIETKMFSSSNPILTLLSSLSPKKSWLFTRRTQIEVNLFAQLIYQFRILLRSMHTHRATLSATLRFIPLILELYIFGSNETRSSSLSILAGLSLVAPMYYGSIHMLICDIIIGFLKTPLDNGRALALLTSNYERNFNIKITEETSLVLKRDAMAFNPMATKKFIEQLVSCLDNELPIELITLGVVGGVSTELLFEKYLTIYMLLSDHDHEGIDHFFAFINTYNTSLKTASVSYFAEAATILHSRTCDNLKENCVLHISRSTDSLRPNDWEWAPHYASDSLSLITEKHAAIMQLAATVHKAIDTICKTSKSATWHSLCFVLVYYIKRYAILPVPVSILKQLFSILGENHMLFIDIYLVFYTTVLLAYSFKEEGTMQHPLTSRVMQVAAYKDVTQPLAVKMVPSNEIHKFLNEKEMVPHLQTLLQLTLLTCHAWCEENSALSKKAVGQQEKTIMWRQMFILGGLNVVRTTLNLLIEKFAKASTESNEPSGYLRVHEHQMLCNIVLRIFEAFPYIRSMFPSLYKVKIHQVMRKLIDLFVIIQENSHFSDLQTYWVGLLVKLMANGNSEEMRVFLNEENAWFLRYITNYKKHEDGNNKATSRIILLSGLINGILLYDLQMAQEIAAEVLQAITARLPQSLNFSQLILPNIAKIITFCIVATQKDILVLTTSSKSHFCGIFKNMSTNNEYDSYIENANRYTEILFTYFKTRIAEWIATDPNSRSVQTSQDVIYYHEAMLFAIIVKNLSMLRGIDSIIDRYKLFRPIANLKNIDICSTELDHHLSSIGRMYVDAIINPSLAECNNLFDILTLGTLHPKEYAFCLKSLAWIFCKYSLSKEYLLLNNVEKLGLIEKYFGQQFVSAMGKYNIIRDKGPSSFMPIISAMDKTMFTESYNMFLHLYNQKNLKQCHGVIPIIILFARVSLLDMNSELPRHLLNFKRLTSSKQPIIKQMAIQFYEAFWKKYTDYENILKLVFLNDDSLGFLQGTKTAISYVS